MIENSHATKNPFSATNAAITASFPTMIQGASHCVTIASASGRIEIRKFIAVVASLRDAHRDAVGAFRVAKRLQILPAGLRHAGDQPLRGELAKRQPRDLEPANERAAATRHFATVHHPRRAGVARKLRQTGVIFLRFELGANGGVFLDRLALAFVAINPGCFCHKGTPNLVAKSRFSTCFSACDSARPQRLSLAQGGSRPGAGRRVPSVCPENRSDCRSSLARVSSSR